MVVEAEVREAQSQWAETVIRVGSLKDHRERCVREAETALCRLYAFDLGPVLFKPTFVREKIFRVDREGVLSYFVGGNTQYPEDKGFALRHWKSIRFENAAMILEERDALVMGNYFFEDPNGGVLKVEFSFGYVKDSQGQLFIRLHHSSYSGFS